KGGFQILISPTHADPHNHRPGLWGRGPCPHQHGDKVLCGGEPPCPEAPPHVEDMWPGMVQEGGALARTPPPFLTCQAACSDKGLVWILGEPHAVFFFFPLITIPDPKGLVWMGG
ncbi:unnamed protein product, partial [Staurois parvus]